MQSVLYPDYPSLLGLYNASGQESPFKQKKERSSPSMWTTITLCCNSSGHSLGRPFERSMLSLNLNKLMRDLANSERRVKEAQI
ncbi:MAG: hypothetical protein DDT24_00799 [Chloroflexi bacterium]|nr:hypothetical protein [Chloroflexota bacterium]